MLNAGSNKSASVDLLQVSSARSDRFLQTVTGGNCTLKQCDTSHGDAAAAAVKWRLALIASFYSFVMLLSLCGVRMCVRQYNTFQKDVLPVERYQRRSVR